MWRLWAKSLGEKASHNKSDADKVAIIRTIIFLSYLITNVFIISGVIRHWNDKTEVIIMIDGDTVKKNESPSMQNL